jgi:hypothetical protein
MSHINAGVTGYFWFDFQLIGTGMLLAGNFSRNARAMLRSFERERLRKRN